LLHFFGVNMSTERIVLHEDGGGDFEPADFSTDFLVVHGGQRCTRLMEFYPMKSKNISLSVVAGAGARKRCLSSIADRAGRGEGG